MEGLIPLIVLIMVVSSIVKNISEKVKGPKNDRSPGDLDGSSLEEQLRRLLGEGEEQAPPPRQPSRPSTPPRPTVERPTVRPARKVAPPVAPPTSRRPAPTAPPKVAPPRPMQPQRQPVSSARPTMPSAKLDDSAQQQAMLERQRRLQAAAPRKKSEPMQAAKSKSRKPYAHKSASRMRRKFNLTPTILAQAVVLSEVIQPPLALRKPEGPHAF